MKGADLKLLARRYSDWSAIRRAEASLWSACGGNWFGRISVCL